MILLLLLSFSSIFNFSYGCQMEDVIFWHFPIIRQIKDIDDGVIFTKSVSDIQGVHNSWYGEATIGGPYFDIDIVDNQFTITTNEAYRRYEHIEVSANMDLTVEFNCVGGGQESLLFLIEVQDTNNNDPEFLPSDVYEFSIAPPLPPNFLLTGCGHEIIARDIDLTTQRIHFGIDANDYFEIEYDEAGSTTAKEFKAILKTTSLIRNLREPIELRISATDEDLTGDDPRTTYATLRVSASSEFDLPDDLLFSQTFYLANYTVDDQLNLAENIVLVQGYDEHVKFELERDGYETNFELRETGDQLAIVVTNPLSTEVMSGNQIYLVVKAEREYTSGATATIVIQLPEVIPLSFEQSLYNGKIENRTLEVPALTLSQGYEDNIVTAQVVGEYSTYFTVTAEGNLVTLTMQDLTDEIIENNNFISLEVEASTIVSKTNTIVSLDIIKDDNVTPVFDKSIYTGTYGPVAGLTVEQIVFVQGFDNTVDIELFGEHKDFFTINRSSIITITASDIPEELFVEHYIVLWIEASKARTVGANAAIIIELPTVTTEETTLVFGQNSYIGSITNENTNIPTVVLIEGYSDIVVFSLLGDLSNYFRINWDQEVVTVSLPEPIPEASVPENKIIVLNIRAVGPEITPVYTTLVLDYAIQEEEIIVSFDKILYEGGLEDNIVSHEIITLSGFMGTEVQLFGENAASFEAQLANNIVTVTRRASVTLPANVTNVALELAAGTARAVLVLNVPNTESPSEPEASFDKVLFEGDIRNGALSHEIITLSGYSGAAVDLIGEYATLFEAHLVNGIMTVNGRESPIPLPSDLTHLALELVAGSARAVLLMNVHSTEPPTVPEVSFNKVVFEGILQNDIVSHESITLTGFTGTNVELFGEFASLFEAQLANNIVTVTTRESPITLPSDFAHITLELVAGSARAVLVLSVHSPEGPIEPDASFNKVVFEGMLQDGVVSHETITLSGFTGTNVDLFGEYASSFEAQLINNIVTVTIGVSVSLPADVTHVALELAAGTARAALVLNVHNTESPTEPEASFDKVLFGGDIRNGVLSHETITLSGYNGATVNLVGEYATIFEAQFVNDIVTVNGRESPITLPSDLTHLALELVAGSARAVLLLNVHSTESPTLPEVSFNKVVFEGTLQNDIVSHETITLTGFTGTNVELFGEFSSLFEVQLANNVVTVTTIESPITLPSDFAHITLELVAGSARAVLVLIVHSPEGPIEPDASFNKVVFEGMLQDGVVTHEPITLSGYTGTDVNLFGEYASSFEVQLTNNIVTVTIGASVSLPADVTHVALELAAGTARAALVLNVHNTESPTEPEASFDKVLFEGDLRNGVLSHETITLTGYNGATVNLIGEYATLFEAQLVNGIVTVNGKESPITLPSDLTHLALELVAGSARAVLLLNVHRTEPPTVPEVSFNKVVFEGTLQNDIVSHESITLTGFTGTIVELFGEFASLFEAQLANNVVTVTRRVSPITLPSHFAHITLELVAGSARAVLVLSVHSPEGPIEPDASFNKVVFEGLLQDGVVSHETITLSGYTGTDVDLFGEYASPFEAQLTNNIVTVTIRASVSLPADVTHVALELAAGTARAALVLNVHNTESPTEPEASFDKVLFEGDLRNGVLSHETITLTGYNGATVNLIGEYATLFEAQLVNGIVTVNGKESPITLPSDLTHLALELVAGSARAVLLLNVHRTEPPTVPEVSFNKVVFEGTLQNDIVSHESITLTGFTGTNVELFGEFASLFEAQLANNVVSVTRSESPITLPSDFAHITLELVAGSARAVLVLSVHSPEAPIEPDASFNKVVFEGMLQDGVVSHETITLSGFTGTNVYLFGEYASSFEAQLTNNILTVTIGASVSLPADITHVALELAAGTARAALVLNVQNTESPTEPEASFDKVLFEGDIRNGVLSHETITLSSYSGATVNLIGEYATLFEAQLVNDIVTVTGRESPIIVPSDITHLALELVAGSARAVLLLNVHRTESPSVPEVSFNKVVFDGTLQNDIVSHETITLTGFTGTNVELFGEFASLFEAQLANNVVTVTRRVSPITLPSHFAHITLELVAGSARAVLVLSVHSPEGPIEPDASFNKVVFEGLLQDGVVSHETITLSGYTGTDVDLFGEYASPFEAQLTNNIVTVTIGASVSLPADVTHVALELAAGTARAALVLNVHNTESPTEPEASFDKVLFEGDIRNGVLSHETITLSSYSGATVNLIGEYATLFEAQLVNGIVTVNGKESPIALPSDLTHLALELVAGSARAVLLINVQSTESPTVPEVSFNKVVFDGTLQNGVVNHETIALTGFTGTDVELFGEFASLFEAQLANNVVTVTTRESPITLPSDFAHITLELVAGSARAVLVLSVHSAEGPIEPDAFFNKVVFEGRFHDGVVLHETIALSGYTGTIVDLFGEYASSFEARLANNMVMVTSGASLTLPADVTHVALELAAGTARAVLVLDVHNTESPSEPDASFDKIIFEGDIRNGVLSHETITISGYSGATVHLIGEYSTLFQAQLVNNIVIVNRIQSPIPLPSDITHLALELVAGSARAVLLLNVHSTESDVSFDKVIYEGTVQNGVVSHETITITRFTGTNVELFGEFASLFEAQLANNIVTIIGRVSPITLPSDFAHITLELVAGSARAVLVLSVHNTEGPIEPDASFNKVVFEGMLQDGVVSHETITLSGFTGNNVELFGEYASSFEAQLTNNIVTITSGASVTLPADVTNVALELAAGTARAVLVLNVHNTDAPTGPEVSFTQVLYEGFLFDGAAIHESIRLSVYNSDTTVEIIGEFASLFEVHMIYNMVLVQERAPVSVPVGVNHITLELAAGTARAVLLLTVRSTGPPPAPPTVTFSAVSYALRVEISQTGIIGQVLATANNGEAINYSLRLNNPHLEERLSINNGGELRLSSPVSGGFYAFLVEGTTVLSQAVGIASVYLSVESVTVCGDELVMPPLIVIDRDEEEHHNNLVVTQHEGCHFEITNRWPLDQNWLYVDDNGLHTISIDREHEDIAFMPVSQIQVEITLVCDTDSSRIKRSLTSDLGPYDYGLNKWILTDTILYNSRKSLVNLIVNDINDNLPIFVNKDSEPIAVGYPIPELQQFVLPRALTQLHATDADIGENAAVVYSSANPELAVAPLTGFVHIRDEAYLEHDARMTVHATDRNGEGLTGSIDIIVKLLDESNIAVVTVNDAFLDDEIDVVSNLSGAVGYDVKVLRSIVVPQDDLQDDEDGTRTKREVTRASGASLQLYVYGIEQREPVSVERLTTDISNSASETVNVANIISLEDHLASLEICSARDTGLLVATIVLAVLLFIVAVLIALWVFLRWRRKNYNQFIDENSLASQNESIDQIPKPEVLPRLNIEELKKSERRLQEMLETPIEEVKVEPAPPVNTDLIELSSKPNSPIINSPIIIQSIDKLKDAEESSDDEFGEVRLPRRKSVVTFNENVEKIIHVEDNEDSEDLESVVDAEVYKF